MLADSQRQLGQAAEALGTLALALAQSEGLGQHYVDAEILRLHGEILLDGDGSAVDEGETLLNRAVATAHAQGAKLWELRAAMSLARLWQQRGRVRDAFELLAPRYAAMSEGLETESVVAARVLLGELDAGSRHTAPSGPRS